MTESTFVKQLRERNTLSLKRLAWSELMEYLETRPELDFDTRETLMSAYGQFIMDRVPVDAPHPRIANPEGTWRD